MYVALLVIVLEYIVTLLQRFIAAIRVSEFLTNGRDLSVSVTTNKQLHMVHLFLLLSSDDVYLLRL